MLGGGFAFGADAFEEGAGGFVVGVLGDEFAGKGLFQDGLAEGLGALQRGVDLPLILLDGREVLFEDADDLALFGEVAADNMVAILVPLLSLASTQSIATAPSETDFFIHAEKSYWVYS